MDKMNEDIKKLCKVKKLANENKREYITMPWSLVMLKGWMEVVADM